MRNQLKGIYAQHIEQFIDLKKTLGFKYDTEKKIFTYFDRFTIKRAEKKVGITKELAESWSQCNPNESSSYKIHRCICLNQLASYLCKIGIPYYMLHLPSHTSTFTPYIFSREQIAAIFAVCDAVSSKKKEWTRQLLSFLHFFDYCMQPVYA
jgi:integrase/recombinase XerD